MNKNELFDYILRLVICETEVCPGQILSARKDTESVDARYLLVHYLVDAGFTPSSIAARTGIPERTVSNIQTNFDTRLSTRKILRIQSENIRKKMGNN